MTTSPCCAGSLSTPRGRRCGRDQESTRRSRGARRLRAVTPTSRITGAFLCCGGMWGGYVPLTRLGQSTRLLFRSGHQAGALGQRRRLSPGRGSFSTRGCRSVLQPLSQAGGTAGHTIRPASRFLPRPVPFGRRPETCGWLSSWHLRSPGRMAWVSLEKAATGLGSQREPGAPGIQEGTQPGYPARLMEPHGTTAVPREASRLLPPGSSEREAGNARCPARCAWALSVVLTGRCLALGCSRRPRCDSGLGSTDPRPAVAAATPAPGYGGSRPPVLAWVSRRQGGGWGWPGRAAAWGSVAAAPGFTSLVSEADSAVCAARSCCPLSTPKPTPPSALPSPRGP